MDRFDESLRYNSYLHRNANVSTCVNQVGWNIPEYLMIRMPDILEPTLAIDIHPHLEDRRIWSPSLNGEFTTKSAYNAIRETR